ncbi:MAG: FKBP-type peptidyl-prolyl cis-trans isomerase [Candidatus Schekmanbacteria bacterium]|nr:FKBP-type peptidyl-prolyl cis-trans isomerase [Candidatus Schekmanbacteria bacterium]
MNRFNLTAGALLIALLILAGTSACDRGTSSDTSSSAANPAAPTTDDQKVLYALGATQAQSIDSFGLSDDEVKSVLQGFTDAALKKPLAVTELKEYRPKIAQFHRVRMEKRTAKLKEEAQAYLTKAAAESGAKQLPSGLIYSEVKAGEGAAPTPEDTVKVHYHGTLTDGTVFDSSVDRGTPAEFPLKGVIKCWTEGVGMMKVGGKAKLVCPSDIAYGDHGRPPVIPPAATLVFEVELLEIVAKPES